MRNLSHVVLDSACTLTAQSHGCADVILLVSELIPNRNDGG